MIEKILSYIFYVISISIWIHLNHFKAFSESSAFSQKMNLLKIIAHFLPILGKKIFSYFGNSYFLQPEKIGALDFKNL